MAINKFYADNWQSQSPGLAKGLSSRMTKLDRLLRGLDDLSNTDQIQGNGADSMKAYISEVHFSFISSLLTTLQTFHTATGVYWNGYKQVDTNGNFRLINGDLKAHIKATNNAISHMNGFENHMRFVSGSVSHLVSLGGAGANAIANVRDDLESMQRIARDQQSTWSAYENWDPGFNQIEEMIATTKRLLQSIGNVKVGRSYQTGTFSQLPEFQNLSNLFTQMSEYNKTNQKVAGDAWQNMFDGYAKDIEAEQKRLEKEKAKKELFWAVVGAVVAGVLIIATAGTATPLVMAGLALDGVLAANQLIASGTKFATGKEFNPLVRGLTAMGMDEGLANTVVTVASFATIAIGGGVALAKVGASTVRLVKAGQLGQTVLRGIKQVPKIPAAAGKSVLAYGSKAKKGASAFGKGFMTELSKRTLSSSLDVSSVPSIFGKATVAGAKEAKSVLSASNKFDDYNNILKNKEVLKSKPKNSPRPQKWLDNGGDISVNMDDIPPTWTYTNKDGVKVRYRNTDGMPDFKESGLVKNEHLPHDGTGFDPRGGNVGRNSDISDAQKLHGKDSSITWHHENDGKTLQAIDYDIHRQFTHRGPISFMKGKK